MADRYNVTTPRIRSDGQTFWMRIGTAWPAKDGGDGMNIILDALPLPDEKGRVSLVIRPAEDRPSGQRTTQPQRRPEQQRSFGDNNVAGFDDDEIPF